MAACKKPHCFRAIVALAAIALAAGGRARGAAYTWDPNGNQADACGVWTAGTGAGNWYDGSADTAWSDGKVAAFGWGSGGTARCTVTLAANIAAGGLVFNNQNYTVSSDAGNLYHLTLGASGITANASATVNVPLTLSAGQTWTTASGQTLAVAGNVAAGGNALTVGGAGNTTIAAALTTTADVDMVGSGTLDLSAVGNTIGGNLNAAGGTLELVGNSTTAAGNVCVANGGGVPAGGSGTLTIKDGAVLSCSAGFYLGNQNGYAGTVNQSGGKLNATFSDITFRVGHWPGETSSYNLCGGVLSVPAATAYVGWDGSGQLNISGGTAAFYGLKLAGGGNTWLHLGTGTLNLSGGLLQLGAGGLDYMAGSCAANLGGGTLAAAATFSSGLPLTFTGSNGNTTLDSGPNTVTLSGNLSGAGGFNKIGAGTLALTQNNTYCGGTIVSGGTLLLNPDLLNNGTGLVGSGPLTINAGAAVETYVNAFGYSPGGLIPIVINGGVLNQLASYLGSDSHLGAVTMTGGTISGTEFQLHSGVSTRATNTTAVISAGTLILQAAVPFSVAAGGASPDLGVSSAISGGYGIVKDGPGVMVISGTNTYTGGTTVDDGLLCVTNPTAIYDGTSLTVAVSGAWLTDPLAKDRPAGGDSPTAPVAAVPEPETVMLLAAALWSAAIYRRFRRRW